MSRPASTTGRNSPAFSSPTTVTAPLIWTAAQKKQLAPTDEIRVALQGWLRDLGFTEIQWITSNFVVRIDDKYTAYVATKDDEIFITVREVSGGGKQVHTDNLADPACFDRCDDFLRKYVGR